MAVAISNYPSTPQVYYLGLSALIPSPSQMDNLMDKLRGANVCMATIVDNTVLYN